MRPCWIIGAKWLRHGVFKVESKPLQELLAIGPYRALYLPSPDPQGPSDELALSFASIGHDPSRAPSAEFIATASGRGGRARAALFIQDESRSWANDPRFDEIVLRAFDKIPRAQKVVALGMSMGGFSALVAAQILPLHAVLAFVPQYSIDPQIMPQESRWKEWQPRLPLRWPCCPLPPSPAQAYLFHANLDDRHHIQAFDHAPNCDHLVFDGLGHSDLVGHLKARGTLSGLLGAAFASDRRRLLRIASSAGAKRLRRDRLIA